MSATKNDRDYIASFNFPHTQKSESESESEIFFIVEFSNIKHKLMKELVSPTCITIYNTVHNS